MTFLPETPVRKKRLFVTDFDGTLFRSDGTVSPEDITSLNALGKNGIIRAIATGRSLYSFSRTNLRDLPIDYLIHSTGSGIKDFRTGETLLSVNMPETDVVTAVRVFTRFGLDLMIHFPLPDNHLFSYWTANGRNGDFATRIDLYHGYASRIDDPARWSGPAAQLLAMSDPDRIDVILPDLRRSLDGFSVINTTSPLNGTTRWIEVFPAGVSKGHAVEWLAKHCGVERADTASVGNDYNDCEMLEATASSYVVENAPARLKGLFHTVPSHNENGVSSAIAHWLAKGGW
jgi:Cof subfamily protein (haloacid dehalogenase superfamily)